MPIFVLPCSVAALIVLPKYGKKNSLLCSASYKQRAKQPPLLAKENQMPEFYLRELRGEECQCGKAKKSGHSFCWECYKSLPNDMQRALYRRYGYGYEEAYDAAVKWLTE
jgi:hypothetical protein